jgi:hypothetical protein
MVKHRFKRLKGTGPHWIFIGIREWILESGFDKCTAISRSGNNKVTTSPVSL